MRSKKTYTEIERARMLYATYKNRLKGQPNAFIQRYPKDSFGGFTKIITGYYGKRCKFCGDIMNTQNISLDHIIPLVRGGTNAIENIQCITKVCNRRKGELTDYEYYRILEFLQDKPEMKRIILKRLSQAGFMFFKRTKV